MKFSKAMNEDGGIGGSVGGVVATGATGQADVKGLPTTTVGGKKKLVRRVMPKTVKV